jgi:hypothetical protein
MCVLINPSDASGPCMHTRSDSGAIMLALERLSTRFLAYNIVGHEDRNVVEQRARYSPRVHTVPALPTACVHSSHCGVCTV